MILNGSFSANCWTLWSSPIWFETICFIPINETLSDVRILLDCTKNICIFITNYRYIFESVRKTGKVIVVDESNPKCSLASEITSLIAEKCFDDLKAAVIKITAPHTPVPFSPPMEDFYIPSTEKITQAIKKLYHG